jgi:hypothetical protein
VPADATAVVMNVTVADATDESFLTVFPTGTTKPNASNLNFGAGQIIPNLVTVKLGTGGKVELANAVGATHVIADVVGYYDDDKATEAGRFIPLVPSRTLDSRETNQPLGPNAYAWLELAGWNGVPATGAGAVVINTTVTGPTAASYLTVFPDDLCEIPLASNLNYSANETVANLSIVRLSHAGDCANAVGAIDFYNLAGTVHVIGDVFGYFTDSTAVIP